MDTNTKQPLIVVNIDRDTWPAKKEKLKTKFPYLKDEDLDYDEGKFEEMIDKLHEKIESVVGKTKAGLHKFIESI